MSESFLSIITECFEGTSKIVAQNEGCSRFIEREIKLELDLRLDSFIKEYLTINTKYPVYSEETLGEVDPFSEKCWIVDPLDGSLNFHKKIPFFSTSISLWDKGMPLEGYVFDYSNKDFYYTNENKSFLNGIELKITEPRYEIVATGIPSHSSQEISLANFSKLLKEYKKIRWFGCASLSLCFVARNCVDAYTELGIKIWDVAAGLAIVKNAGGKIEYTVNSDNSLNTIARWGES